MYYVYTIDELADEPIMLLNGYIGSNPDVERTIMAEQFESEIYALDAAGKKRIKIFINSPGGKVIAGMGIYSAILNVKAKVDTYNVGVAASIAAVIFQAGDKRYMADYSKLMFHNPFPRVGTASRTELAAWKDAIVKMVSGRSGESDEEVGKMMDATTWMGAEEAVNRGYCDKVEYGMKSMASQMSNFAFDEENVENSWSELSEIINSSITEEFPKQKDNQIEIENNMSTNLSEIANSLGLIPEANVDSILKVVNSIKQEKEEAVSQLNAEKQAHEETRNKLTEVENRVADVERQAQEAKKAELRSAAEVMVNQAVADGKVENSPEAINAWIENAVINFEGTKTQLSSIPVNKKAEEIPAGTGEEVQNFLTNELTGKNHTIASVMAEVAANQNK